MQQDESGRKRQNSGVIQDVTSERDSKVSTSRGSHDDHLLRLEPKVVDEITITGDGVNQGRRERVGSRIRIGSAQAVFQSENAPNVCRDVQESGHGGDINARWVGSVNCITPSVKIKNDLFVGRGRWGVDWVRVGGKVEVRGGAAVPIARNFDCLDVARLGPFKDLSFDKFGCRLKPDTFCGTGRGYSGVVGECKRTRSTPPLSLLPSFKSIFKATYWYVTESVNLIILIPMDLVQLQLGLCRQLLGMDEMAQNGSDNTTLPMI